MTGPAVRHRRDASQRRLRSVAVTEEAMDTVVTGMHFMAEGERLNRRAVTKIQWQHVHYHQTGDNSSPRYNQPGNKPCFFHDIHQGKREIDRRDKLVKRLNIIASGCRLSIQEQSRTHRQQMCRSEIRRSWSITKSVL